ncbi:GntR family transcriptional regulator [Rhodovibrionaceae bacterium A322]
MAATRKTKSKEPFSHKAYTALKARILRNEMPAGRAFLEQELAEQLEMSRTPVREAMLRLEKEGLVEVRPRHGMIVRHISTEDMREIYEVLTSLESTAAGLAAARGPSTEEMAPLSQAVADMEDALQREDLSGWATADEHFHKSLVDLSANQRLIDLVQTFMDQAQRVRLLTLRLRPKPEGSNRDHRAVLEAIAKGQAEQARSIHRRHREVSGKMLVELLESHGLHQL